MFLLVDEGTVEKYKADLSDEIEPQITELISRAEKGMKLLQKKHLALQTKVRGTLYVRRGVLSLKARFRSKQLIRGHNHAQRLVGRIVACKCS